MFFEDSQKSTSLLCVLNGQGLLSGSLGGLRINLKDLKVDKIKKSRTLFILIHPLNHLGKPGYMRGF